MTCPARLCLAWHSLVRPSLAWFSPALSAGLNSYRSGSFQPGLAWYGSGFPDMLWHTVAWHGINQLYAVHWLHSLAQSA